MDSIFTEPRPIYREGKKLEMYKLLDELEAQYTADLKSSVDTYNSYEEVSNETFNDLRALKMTLKIIQILGYLSPEEVEGMEEVAEEMRSQALAAMETFA
jgi:hypothetical protein